MCGNVQYGNDHDSFSSVVDFTIIKLLLCVAIHRNYVVNHFYF